jgi:hypothetical protein
LAIKLDAGFDGLGGLQSAVEPDTTTLDRTRVTDRSAGDLACCGCAEIDIDHRRPPSPGHGMPDRLRWSPTAQIGKLQPRRGYVKMTETAGFPFPLSFPTPSSRPNALRCNRLFLTRC